MFNRLIPVFTLSAAVAMASAHLSAPLCLAMSDSRAPEQMTDRIVVKIKPGQESNVAKVYARSGIKLISSIPQIGWHVLLLPSGTSVSAGIAKLKSVAGVLKVAPDIILRPNTTTVNDPMFSSQYSLQKMQVPNAWDLSTSNASTIVAVLDTGCDYTHPDLANKIIKGKDFADNDDDPMDGSGHGTHVAGIVAAETNNGVGVAGSGYNTKILAVRVLGVNGGSADSVAKGIVYAADNGANIINMSLGATGVSSEPLEDDAIKYAYEQKNVVIIASAGNSGDAGNPHNYPAFNSTCIAVGASDRNDQQASFSEFNPVDGSDNWVDVAAPGVDVLSTLMGPTYGNESGTSMAAPNTAGVASLIWSSLASGGTTPKNSEVRRLIEENCDYIGTWINNGRVNAFSALNAIGVPVSSTPTPTSPVAKDGRVTGTGAVIGTKNGVSATVNAAKKPGIGLSGSFTTSFAMSGVTESELRGATLNLTMSGDAYTTVQIYFFDQSQNQYVIYRAQPNRTAMTTTSYKLSLSTLSKYMIGNQLPVMIRTLVPTAMVNRSNGITKIDQASVTFTGVRRPVATP